MGFLSSSTLTVILLLMIMGLFIANMVISGRKKRR